MMGLMASLGDHVIHDASVRIYIMSTLTSGAAELVKIELSDAAALCRYYASPAGKKLKMCNVNWFSSEYDSRGTLEVKVAVACHEFLSSTAVQRAPMYITYVETKLSCRWCSMEARERGPSKVSSSSLSRNLR
ncbi:hypothetical protein TNCV_3168951 [Trichonephila clavipes]|nr:hypothetical protein TNCV_3168951 [Trichonephila clavipes]